MEKNTHLYSLELMIFSGKGGNGCISFRREAFIPKGGPDGGDGGRGGSVFIKGSRKLLTFADFNQKKLFKARNGKDGSSNGKTGAGGDDITIIVPVGTEIWCDGKLLFDITDEQPRMIAKGGKGGLGNQHFATPDLQAPYIATDGYPGQEKTISLVLKYMADVGVIGMPNAGKSTLVHKVSRAKVKIGDYAFSTLEPVLGIIRRDGATDSKQAKDSSNESKKTSKRHKNADKFLQLENDLLSPQTRKSATELDTLIADSFIEPRSSGKIYNKKATIEAILSEERTDFKITDPKVIALSDEMTLVIYKLHEDNKTTVRSSIWSEIEDRHQIVFHQGTPISEIIDGESVDLNRSVDQIVIADLPGLMDGSHMNVGLGHRFLQHLYRCKLFLHVVDGSEENAIDNFNTIINEVRLYDPELLKKEQIVCISKSDISDPDAILLLKTDLTSMGYNVIVMSESCDNVIKLLFDAITHLNSCLIKD